jgi:hypothetical protein
MDASTRFETQVVGALPLVAHYFALLSLGAIIDEVVPWEGDVPLGTLTELPIANRLLNPKALFKVGDWARKAGLTDYYGLSAEQLNDDRLGRAWERLAAHAPTVQAALVLKMIKTFKLDVSQIHFEITSVELYGAYPRRRRPCRPPLRCPPTVTPRVAASTSGRFHSA